MSEYHIVTREDIDFDMGCREVDIFVTSNDQGNVYATIKFDDILDMAKKIIEYKASSEV